MDKISRRKKFSSTRLENGWRHHNGVFECSLVTISWEWHNFQLYRYVDSWHVQYDHIALVKDYVTQSPGLLGDTNYWAVAVHMNKSNMPQTPTLDESWGEHKFWYLSSRNSSISLLPWAAARTTGGWPVGDFTEVKNRVHPCILTWSEVCFTYIV